MYTLFPSLNELVGCRYYFNMTKNSANMIFYAFCILPTF